MVLSLPKALGHVHEWIGLVRIGPSAHTGFIGKFESDDAVSARGSCSGAFPMHRLSLVLCICVFLKSQDPAHHHTCPEWYQQHAHMHVSQLKMTYSCVART